MANVAVNGDTVGGIPTLALTQSFVAIDGIKVILKSGADIGVNLQYSMITASTQSYCRINSIPIVVMGDIATNLIPIIATSFVNIS